MTAAPCEFDEMPTNRFLDLLHDRIDVLRSVQLHLAREACSLRARALEIRTLSPRQLLQSTLAHFVPPGSERLRNVRLTLPITHREIAQIVGVTPEHLCRLLRQLESESLITRSKGWIIVRHVHQFAVTP